MFLANYVPKCQMSFGPYGPIFTLRQCVFTSSHAIHFSPAYSYLDDSGRWGTGGLFSALSTRSLKPEGQYKLAGKMRDLALGDTHLVPIDDIQSRSTGTDYVSIMYNEYMYVRVVSVYIFCN